MESRREISEFTQPSLAMTERRFFRWEILTSICSVCLTFQALSQTVPGFDVTHYATVTDPIYLSFSPDGTLFAGRDASGSDGNSGTAVPVHRISPGGLSVAEYGPAIEDPDGVFYDATGAFSGTAGSVLVASGTSAGGIIQAIQPDLTLTTVLPANATYGNPDQMRLDHTGRLLFLTHSGTSGIWALPPGEPPTHLATLPGGAWPVGIAVDPENRIYAAGNDGVIRLYDSDGSLLDGNVASGLTSARIALAAGGAFGTNLWMAVEDGRLLTLDPGTGELVQRGDGFTNAKELVFGPDGGLYVSEFENDRVLRITPACVPVPTGVVGWWRGEADALDSAGTNHGTLVNGASFTNGIVGQSFHLDGVDDYVDVGALDGLRGADEITVMAWVKKGHGNDSFGGIIGQWNNSPDTNNRFLLYNGESASMHRGSFVLQFDDGTRGVIRGTSVFPVSEWTHVAAVWRGSDGFMGLYKNGVLENVSTQGVGRVLSSVAAPTAKVGEWGVVRDQLYKWPGQIDELLVSNRALGEEEIGAIVAANSVGFCDECTPIPSGIVSWWRGEGNAVDSVSTNHGTVLNGAGFTNAMVGRGFSLDGVDDGVEFPGVPFGDLPSFGVWIQTEQPGRVIVDGGAGTLGYQTWRLALDAQGHPVYQHARNGTGGYVQIVGPSAVADGTFHYLCVTTDQETKTLKLYVDGVEVSTHTETDPAFLSWAFAEAGASWLGKGDANGLPAQAPFEGVLDEAELYDRPLTADEIASIYLASSAGKCVPDCTFAYLANVFPGRPVRVATVSTNKAGLCDELPLDFVNSTVYETLRNELLDPARFGTNGTVDRPVELLPPVDTITDEALISADLVLLQGGKYSAAEKDALRRFANCGGGIVAFNNGAAVALEGIVGATAGDFTGSAQAMVTTSDSPVTSGPFGQVALNTILSTGFAGSFASDGLGENGTPFMSNDAGVLGATFTVGAGRVAAFCDEELFINPPSISGCFAAHLNASSTTLFLNAVAHVLPRSEVVGPIGPLNIRREGDLVVVEWPLDCVGCVLEETDQLGPNALWLPSGLQPQEVNDLYRVSLMATNAQRFYRLSVPSE